MKVARFTEAGHTRLGIVTGDTTIIDVGHADPACPTTSVSLLAIGGLSRVADLAANAPLIALTDVVLEAPIAQPPTLPRDRAELQRPRGRVAAWTKPDGTGRVQQADHVCHRPVDGRSRCRRSRPTGSTTRASSAS